MSNTAPTNRSNQHLQSRGSLGTGAGDIATQRGPCGIDYGQASCRKLHVNLFSVLRASPEFSRVFDELKGTGVKIVPNNELSIGASSSRNRGAGTYNPITGTIDLPTKVYASDDEIRSTDALKLIAHELYHAWQFRKLHEVSGGGSDEERAKVIAQSVEKMGRDRFIKSTLKMEYDAERFAMRVVLQALKDDHTGLRLYRSEIGPITPSGFYHWNVDGWWEANESVYRSDAEIEWVQWMYRLAEGDYKADFDKQALKAWLQRNPTIR